MRFSNEEKMMWLADWKSSGKSLWKYAKENGLCPQTFAKWTQVKNESQSGFVEVPAKVIQPLQYAQEILIKKKEISKFISR